MGTNYYARIIPSKKDRLQLMSIMNNPKQDWREIRHKFNSMYSSYDGISHEGGEIHLGKRSSGWKFLWNPNVYIERHGHSVVEKIDEHSSEYHWVEEPNTLFYLYPLTKKGIKKFLKDPRIRIFNEYEEEEDKDEFFEMALNWGKEDGWDSKSYDAWERERNSNYIPHNCSSELTRMLEKEGYKFITPFQSDFYSDGLRFASSTEFC